MSSTSAELEAHETAHDDVGVLAEELGGVVRGELGVAVSPLRSSERVVQVAARRLRQGLVGSQEAVMGAFEGVLTRRTTVIERRT